MTEPTRVDVSVPTMAPDGRTAVYLVGGGDGGGTGTPDAGTDAADSQTGAVSNEPDAAGSQTGAASNEPDAAGGDAVLVVDPATTSDELVDAVGDAEHLHLAATHHHPDHVGGLADLAARFPATVWARRGRESAFEAAAGVAPDRTFSPGTVLPLAGGVAVVDTPGHAPEHVAFGAGDWLVTGDLAVAEGSVVVGGPGADMRAYLTSLRRIHARNPDRLYPAHGPVIEDVRGTCGRLIHHRLDRERAVLRAVRDGAATTEAILEAAYDKDLSGVRELALATVETHLQKLAREGKVRWVDGRVQPIP